MLTELNPDIREIVIGIKNLRKIVIYPLSVGQQLEMTDIIASMMTELITSDDDVVSVLSLVPLVASNIKTFLKYTLDDEEMVDEVIGEMTNPQMLFIVETIIEVNYESIAKNVTSLIKKFQKKFPNLMRSSQQLSPNPVTELNISTKEESKEGVSP